MSNLSSTSAPWAQIATMWNDCFTPPSRISEQERKCYRDWMGASPNTLSPKALVLGATPEIREELFSAGYQTTCLDLSHDMIMAMNALLKIKPPNEIFVEGNWLDAPLADKFDLVIGDAVLPNIPWKDRDQLLSRVAHFLKPDGVFLTRAFCAPENPRLHGVADILKDARNKSGVSFYQQSLELVLDLQYLTRDSKDRRGSFKKAKEELDRYLNDHPTMHSDEGLKDLIAHQYSFWFARFLEKVFVYATVAEEEAGYRKYFSIEKRFEASDHRYGALTPMYLLKKRPNT